MNIMCPKCGGEAFLTDEDFVQVIEKVDPVKVVLKATHTCRSCTERFSRLVFEDINARPRPEMMRPTGYQQPPNPYQYGRQQPVQQKQPVQSQPFSRPEEGLKFLDKI